MRNAIRNKYHLIKYYYTQLFMMSAFKPTQVTTPFFNALFFEFPDDEEAYKNVQYNIMLGPSLKLSVLTDKLG
jgi:alpha-glucosidase (family GH31 glycosyl hydrolase)